MKAVGSLIRPFPCASNSTGRRTLRKELLNALRVSGALVILDLSGCPILNREDIGLLLECLGQAAGRDTQVLLVAGPRVNRVLLEVSRISSLVRVFDSVEEALAHPQLAAENHAEDRRASQSQNFGAQK